VTNFIIFKEQIKIKNTQVNLKYSSTTRRTKIGNTPNSTAQFCLKNITNQTVDANEQNCLKNE